MLQLFRKYQKLLYICVTTVIILSFSFFGTYSAIFDNDSKVQDREVGKTYSGRSLKESELYTLNRFISYDKNMSFSRNSYPNYFNDGIIASDFLKTSLAHFLFETYYDEMKDEMEESWNKMRRYTPYRHPEAPFLSAEAVWSRFAPEIPQMLNTLKSQDEFNLESFEIMADLYLEQCRFNPNMLRRVLVYQQKQYPSITPDQRLYHDDLMLFGFSSASDWFSNKFINLVSQYLVNSAEIAEERGYVVSDTEAKIDLMNGIQLAIQNNDQEISLQEVYKKQLDILGLDERKAVSLWKSVLLFRRYLSDQAGSIFLDPATFEDFESYASLTADVERFQMAPEFQFYSATDSAKFDIYMGEVTRSHDESLNCSFYSKEEMKELSPEFVHRNFSVEMASLSSEKASLLLPVKKMWDWQLSDANWNRLTSNFPSLKGTSLKTREERFKMLEELSAPIRAKVDHFSRNEMLKSSPEIIISALEKTPLRRVELSISHDGQVYGCDIQDPHFVALLEKAPSMDQEIITNGETRAQNELLAYTQDNKLYYKVRLIKRDDQARVLTFRDANQLGLLQKILDTRLKNQFAKVQKTHPARFKGKDFFDVQEEVAEVLYDDPKSLFTPFLERVQADFVQNGNHSEFLKGHADPILAQFKIIAQNDTILRSHSNADLFELEKGAFSPVQDNSFFKMNEKTIKDSGAIALAKELLESEAKLTLGRALLSDMKDSLIFKE